MIVKYLHWFGIAACIMLIISCFLPWVYYADPNIANEAERTFTGFYSYKNEYGKPGKFLVFFGLIALIFMLLPKVWAKRANIFVCALILAFAVRNYILFSSCYNNYCPQKLFSIYLMVFCTVLMMLAAVFPKLKIAGGQSPN